MVALQLEGGTTLFSLKFRWSRKWESKQTFKPGKSRERLINLPDFTSAMP